MRISMTEMKTLTQKGMIVKGKRTRYQMEAIIYKGEAKVNSE